MVRLAPLRVSRVRCFSHYLILQNTKGLLPWSDYGQDPGQAKLSSPQRACVLRWEAPGIVPKSQPAGR